MAARIILGALFLLAMLPHVFAQPYQERLSDNELRAAYCLGYFKAGQQQLQNVCQNPTAPMAQACVASEQEQNARTQRVLGYLAAKGVILTPGPNGLDAMVAVAQGRADFQSCVNWSKTPEASACATKCLGLPADEAMKCMNGVNGCLPALCRKAATCVNLSYLPY